MNDIRVYNYYDNDRLISRMTQAKEYFDEKFGNIHEDIDFSEVDHRINCSTHKILHAIEDSKPCLCNLATKEDVCKAKHQLIDKIDSSKKEIIEEIDEKFVDLNELIK